MCVYIYTQLHIEKKIQFQANYICHVEAKATLESQEEHSTREYIYIYRYTHTHTYLLSEDKYAKWLESYSLLHYYCTTL